MIGGMRTIMNGAFEIDTGDMLQWYWTAETNCFDPNGRRREQIGEVRSSGVNAFLQGNNSRLSSDSERRRAMYERSNGVFTTSGNQQGGDPTTFVYNGKKEVAFPKSLRPGRDGQYRLSDKMRVFARAMSGARPFEMFDVMISRQSM